MNQRFKIGDSRVLESRESSDGLAIRRRRETPSGYRFTTYERLERRTIIVVKKDGTREEFDRDKLGNAFRRSVGKFFDSEQAVEAAVDDIEDSVYALGESEIASKRIGEMVLEKLAATNEVAYVRFASVFHEFRTLDDFVNILKHTRAKKKGGTHAS
ncbi:transcriptional repressor [Candidatus Saccharibacteria bacterium]|nr:MAG: transcriptional repressor [Candidatus Saccharibacteria bacterium]